MTSKAKRPTARYAEHRKAKVHKVAFTTTVRGKPMAYLWEGGTKSGRWIRVGSDAAKIMIATGAAVEVPYLRERRKGIEQETVAEAKKDGPGFYVTDASTGLYRTRTALLGPFTDKEEAITEAWAIYSEIVDHQMNYRLPLVVIESLSRGRAEDRDGHVWWFDGRRKAGPERAGEARLFGNQKRRGRG